MVQDALGRGISGVEILVVALGDPAASPSTLISDERGRFSLESLGPGNFLLALNKPGYAIRFAQANSHLLSLLRIRLSVDDSIRAGSDSAASMDWVLRLPRSDVLKEEAPSVAVQGAEQPEEAAASRSTAALSVALPVRTELNQWYTSSLSSAGDPQSPGSTGRSTHVQVRGDLPGKGDWEVRGLSESVNTEGQNPIGRYGLDQGANRLRLAMRYSLSPSDSLQVQARFDRDSLHSDNEMDAASPANQAVRTLGYRASWVRSLGEDSRLDVAMGFLDSRARVPGPFEPSGAQNPDDELRDWNWNAHAGYSFQLPGEHHLNLAARTRFYNYDQADTGWILAPLRGEITMLDLGQRGWAVTLSGEDSWRLTKPMSLILGLDTHYSAYGDRSLFIVPKVGARREVDRSMIQGWVMFRSESSGPSETSEVASSGPSGSEAVGFRAEVLQRLPGEWVLGGHVERNPAGNALLDDQAVAGISRGEGMVMTDATSWSQEAGMSVSKSIKGIRGSLESDQGWIVGRVAGGIEETPVLVLEQGGIRYLALKINASVEKTDTQVRLGYTRLAGDGAEADEGSAASASRIDVTVFQPIPFVSNRGAGSWRVLLGYQSLSALPGVAAEVEPGAPPERVHRFSGGLGVTF